MPKLSCHPNVILLLAAAGLLVACGGKATVQGSVVVNPNSTSTLTIEGTAKTTLELHQPGAQPVVMADGPDERRLEQGASLTLTFEGPKELLFRNEGSQSARIRYEATSPGGVSSRLVQR